VCASTDSRKVSQSSRRQWQTVTDYEGFPKPVQRPHPPILIGGGGKRVLSYAAREADIIGINGTMTAGVVGPEAISTMTAAAVSEKVDIVRNAAGSRLPDIEMNIRSFFVKVTTTAAEARETIDGVAQMIGVSADMVEETPFALIGPPEKLVDDLIARRERWGFSYVIVGAEDVDSFAPVVAALNGK
jgi:alkanesulfonate monooxygenase SsuD/methylene tetrahydromethanopterin reductase-like flavin-dependent oxidoreductase (luciferase family)